MEWVRGVRLSSWFVTTFRSTWNFIRVRDCRWLQTKNRPSLQLQCQLLYLSFNPCEANECRMEDFPSNECSYYQAECSVANGRVGYVWLLKQQKLTTSCQTWIRLRQHRQALSASHHLVEQLLFLQLVFQHLVSCEQHRLCYWHFRLGHEMIHLWDNHMANQTLWLP